MHKRLIIILLALFSLSVCLSNAQPRSVGLRGLYGFDVSYQHYLPEPAFLQVDLGVDSAGQSGYKVMGTYNWVIARPSWATKGEWTWYCGPGATMGYVVDDVGGDGLGFMVGFVAMLGLEYALPNHLAFSVDVDPQFGYHAGDDSFYHAGLMGLIPSLAIRYKF